VCLLQRVERIRASLHLVGGVPSGIEVPSKAAEVLGLTDAGGATRKGHKNAPPPKHTIFVESREEAEAVVGPERASLLFGVRTKAAGRDAGGEEDHDDDDGDGAFEKTSGRKRRRAAPHHEDEDDNDEDKEVGNEDEDEEDVDEDEETRFPRRKVARNAAASAAPSASKRVALAQRGPAMTFSDIAASSREDAASQEAKATKKGGARASAAPKKEAKLSGKDARKSKVALQASLNELAERAERSDKLGRLIQQIGTERALLQKGRRVKVAEATKTTGAVYKWKAQRKK
jgi:hypothetical protein